MAGSERPSPICSAPRAARMYRPHGCACSPANPKRSRPARWLKSARCDGRGSGCRVARGDAAGAAMRAWCALRATAPAAGRARARRWPAWLAMYSANEDTDFELPYQLDSNCVVVLTVAGPVPLTAMRVPAGAPVRLMLTLWFVSAAPPAARSPGAVTGTKPGVPPAKS